VPFCGNCGEFLTRGSQDCGGCGAPAISVDTTTQTTGQNKNVPRDSRQIVETPPEQVDAWLDTREATGPNRERDQATGARKKNPPKRRSAR
jgi:hypothetical protein